MVRRTKEEAQQTRSQILAAARRCFHERGVANTSLEHIAQDAGVTRGAIYWHFANKEELFRAMREEVELPLVDQTDFTLLQDRANEPLTRVRNFMIELVDAVMGQAPLRQTFEIMEFKCEYVGSFADDLLAHVAELNDFTAKMQRVYQEAHRLGLLRPGLTPKLAALESVCFVMGVMRMWLLDQGSTLVRKDVHALIEAHMQGRAPALASAPPPGGGKLRPGSPDPER